MSISKLTLQKIEITKKVLKSLGIDPDQPSKHSLPENPMTKAEFFAHWLQGDSKTIYEETNHWPAGERQFVTGRKYHLGQLVWVHDRMDQNHPIVAKAAICQFSEKEKLGKVKERNYIYCDMYTYYITDQESWDATKLYCLEPIKEIDQDKTANEMQAERKEIKIRCTEAELKGLITVRQIIKEKNGLETGVEIFGAGSEWLKGKINLWFQLISQICEDEGISKNEIEKLQPWITLSPKACEIFHAFKMGKIAA